MSTGCDSIREPMDFFREFTKKSLDLRVPLSGGIELTRRCNLRCVHCYQGSEREPAKALISEMSKDKIFTLLDQIRDAGCLFLLLTGGEPLLRKDFKEIYTYVKHLGMLPIVFTNGTLLDEKTTGLFSELPPYVVEISLYGAGSETYRNVTGQPGAFRACVEAIERLLEAGITPRLKTVLMSLNRNDFTVIEAMAKNYGLAFRVDSCLFPKFDGDASPLGLRIPVSEAVEREFSDPIRRTGWKDFYDQQKKIKRTDSLYTCGAGLRNFHIDAAGLLMPCVMVRGFRFDLNKGSFHEGWKKMSGLSEKKILHEHRCAECEAMSLCGYCPGFFQLENGDENTPSEYLCETGKARYARLCE